MSFAASAILVGWQISREGRKRNDFLTRRSNFQLSREKPDISPRNYPKEEEETGENYPLETEPFLFFLSVSWPPCNAAINNFNRNPFTAHYQYASI